MKYCYCPFCGTKNSVKNKKCVSCKKKIKEVDQDFMNLVTGSVQGKIEEGILSVILSFIKAHTYGVLLSITLIAVTVPNIVLANNKPKNIVQEKPWILTQTNSCISKKFKEKYTYVYQTKEECIHEGYRIFEDESASIDERIFTFSCDEVIDDCNETWYGIYFNIFDSETQSIKKLYY